MLCFILMVKISFIIFLIIDWSGEVMLFIFKLEVSLIEFILFLCFMFIIDFLIFENIYFGYIYWK